MRNSTTTRADHDRRAQRGGAGDGRQEDLLDLEPGAQVRRRRACSAARSRRGRRSARLRRARPPRRSSPPSAGRGRRSRRSPPASIEWTGSRRSSSRRAPPRGPTPVRRSAADDVHVVQELGPPRQRAHGPALRRRGGAARRPPTYPVAPVTSSMGESQYLPEIRPPEKCAACGASQSDPANSGKPWVAQNADLLLDGHRAEDEARPLRGLLLQAEHAVRAQPRQAVHDVPAGRARPRPGAPARVRLPHRADDRGVRISSAARLAAELVSAHAAHGARQVAVLAGRRRRLFRLPDPGGRHVGPRGLRQRRVREAARARRLRGRRRGGALAPPRRPLPRPRPLLLRAHLRAAPAARAGGPLAGHRLPRLPGAPRSARRAGDVPPRGGRLGQRGPDRERLRPARVRPGRRRSRSARSASLPAGAALHGDLRHEHQLVERLRADRLRRRLQADRRARGVRARRRPDARRGHAAAPGADRHARAPHRRGGRRPRPGRRRQAAAARPHLRRARRGRRARPGRRGVRAARSRWRSRALRSRSDRPILGPGDLAARPVRKLRAHAARDGRAVRRGLRAAGRGCAAAASRRASTSITRTTRRGRW